VTKAFVKRAGTLLYYNYSRNGPRDGVIFANRSANRGSFLYPPNSSSGGGEAADIFCRNEREEKELGRERRTRGGRRGERKREREREGERERKKEDESEEKRDTRSERSDGREEGK